MATITFTTTADEDAAILALSEAAVAGTPTPPETVEAYLLRHLRHQTGFAVQVQQAALKAVYDILPPAEKAAVDEILTRNKPEKAK